MFFLPEITPPLISTTSATAPKTDRCHALHETGGKPTEAAVAQRRVRLELTQIVELDTEFAQCRSDLIRQAEIAGRVGQKSSDEKLEAQIIDPFAPLLADTARGGDPAVDDLVAQGQGCRGVPVMGAGMLRILADSIEQLFEDAAAQIPHRSWNDGFDIHHVTSSSLGRATAREWGPKAMLAAASGLEFKSR